MAYGTTVGLVIAGAGAAVAFSGTLGQALALVLVGLGLVLVTSLAFYEVGLSEDKDLAEARARRRVAQGREDGHPARRLGRMRGRPRRLR